MANTNPNYRTGQIPSASTWNSTYTEKVDATDGELTTPTLNGGTVNGNIGGSPTIAGIWTFAGGLILTSSALHTLAESLQTVYLGTIALSEPYDNQIFQRTTRTGGLNSVGTGFIQLTINPTEPITRLDHRLRNASSPTVVIQDWTNSVPPISAGSQVVFLEAPAGLAKYLVDLRANYDADSIVSTTLPVMMGELIGLAGQSLAEDMVTNAASGDPTTYTSLGLTVSPWAWIFTAYASNTGAFPPVPDGPDVNYPPTAFLQSSTTVSPPAFKSSFAVEFCNLMIALTGVPCGMIGYAVGGTGIATWLPGTTHWDKLVNVVTLAGSRFSIWIWDQGHYETKDGNTAPNYLSQLQELSSGFAAQFPDATYWEIVATIPGIGNYGDGPTAIELVRNTAKEFVSGNALMAYVDGLDSTLYADLVHPSQAGNIIYARHFYRAIANKLGLLSHGDKGPFVTSASREYNSKNIVLAVNQLNGGTAWQSAGAPENQFQVFAAGTTSPVVALDGVAPIDLSDAAQITLQLATAPTEPQAYDVWYRRPPDTSTTVLGAIYDNVTDGDGLTNGRQLWDPAAAISVPAPTITLTMSAIADTTPSATINITGTYSPVAPPLLDYSLNGGSTWTAAGAVIGGGSFSFTIGTGPTTGGVFKVRVRDHVQQANTGVSNAFFVVTAGLPTLPVLTAPIFALDAYDATGGLYANTSRTDQAAVGDVVRGVTDQTSNGNNFTQTVAGQSPTLEANIKNTLPGLRFTGSLSQCLTQISGTISATLKTSTGYCLLVVATPATLPGSGSQAYVSLGRPVATGLDRVRIHILPSGISRYSRNGDASFTSAAAPSGTTATTLVKSVSRWNGTTQKILVNALAEGSIAGAGTFALTWTEQSTIGADNDLPLENFFDGWIHEIRVWNSAVSDGDRDALMTYATNKWG